MNIFESLSPVQMTWARKGVLLFLCLLNIFVFTLVLSYGASAWKEVRALKKSELQIAVTGEGKVSAKPDIAKLTATVQTEHSSLLEAQKGNTNRANAVTAYLKARSVAEKDIKTVGYNIYPQYSYPRPCDPYLSCPVESQTPKIIGYQVRNTLEITIRNLGEAGNIVSGIVNAGANEISNLQFTFDDPDELREEARQAAIDDARVKAKTLAKSLGRRLGDIVSFNESGSGIPVPIYYAAEVGKGGGMGGGGPELPGGENEIVVNVSVTYEFR